MAQDWLAAKAKRQREAQQAAPPARQPSIFQVEAEKRGGEKTERTKQAEAEQAIVEAQKAQEQFEAENVKLDTDEYITKSEFEKLSTEDQKYIKEKGITEYNKLLVERGERELSKYTKLDTDEYVSNELFNSLTPAEQQQLKKEGIEEFNKYIEKWNKIREKNKEILQEYLTGWSPEFVSRFPVTTVPVYDIKGNLLNDALPTRAQWTAGYTMIRLDPKDEKSIGIPVKKGTEGYIFELAQKLPEGYSINPWMMRTGDCLGAASETQHVKITDSKGNTVDLPIAVAVKEIRDTGTIKVPEPVNIPQPSSYNYGDYVNSAGRPLKEQPQYYEVKYVKFNVNGKDYVTREEYADKYRTMLETVGKPGSNYSSVHMPSPYSSEVVYTTKDGKKESKPLGDAYNTIMSNGQWWKNPYYGTGSSQFNVYIGPPSALGGTWGNTPATMAAQVSGVSNLINFQTIDSSGTIRPSTQEEIAKTIQSTLQQFTPSQMAEYKSEITALKQIAKENPGDDPLIIRQQQRAKETLAQEMATRGAIEQASLAKIAGISQSSLDIIDKLNQGLVKFDDLTEKQKDELGKTAVQTASGDWTVKEDFARAMGYVVTSLGEMVKKEDFDAFGNDEEARDILLSKGIEYYNKWAEDRPLPEGQIKLKSGEIVNKKEFETLPAKLQIIASEKGLNAINISNLPPQEQFNKLKDFGLIEQSAEYGGVDSTTGEIILKDGRPWQEKYLNAEFAKDVGIGIIPIAGTYYFWNRMNPWEKGASIALDILTLIPFTTAISAGVRAGKGAWTSVGRAVLAEVKAPVTSILHPIETVKGLTSPLVTALKPSRIPVTAAEIRYNTVKIPVEAIGNAQDAKQARDILTQKAIQGEKAKIDINGTNIELTPIALQQKIGTAAVSATSDVRPFMAGTTVNTGREGGLFVSPTLHSRFTTSSAFGDMPKGGIPGALIIRDKKILESLQPSGKIYRNTAEVEKVIPSGMNLPAPSQILKMKSTPLEFSSNMRSMQKATDKINYGIKNKNTALINRGTSELEKLQDAIIKENRRLEAIAKRSKEQNIDMMMNKSHLRHIDDLQDAIKSKDIDVIDDVLEGLNEIERRSKIDELNILVIGYPLTRAEINNLKLTGAADVIRDIFVPALRISGKGIKEIDELADLGREARQIEQNIETARTAKNTDKAKALESQLQSINARAREIAKQADNAYRMSQSGRTALRTVGISTGDYIDRLTYREMARQNPDAFSRILSKIEQTDRNRILRDLNKNDRAIVERGIKRIAVQERTRVPRTVTAEQRDIVRADGERVPARDIRVPRGTDRVITDIQRGITTRPPQRPPIGTTVRPPVITTTRPPGRPPVRPPGRPPLIPPPGKKITKFSELTREQKLASITWRQGLFYHLVYPPYGQYDVLHSTKPFPGVKVVKGPQSAYKSLSRVKGEALPDKVEWDLGIQDIVFERGKKGVIKMTYVPDVKQQTTKRRPIGMPQTVTKSAGVIRR